MKNKIFQVSGDYYNKFIFDSIQFSYSLIDNNTISLSLKDSNSNTFSTKLIVEAYHGICKASDSTTLNIIKDENDKIANSVELKLGLNGPFSNQCSNIEENEPSPPFNGCYADNSWCTENNSKETIRNTIWFKLKGPSNGILNLKTSGFNTRIALYEANTANDLLNNNYKLLAANDDNASGTSAILKNVHVVPGKTYYLQLDGYKGEVGECFINYYSENIEIFPNPTISYINIIISSENEAEGTLKIFNLSGEQMASKKIKITPQLNKFIFDLSALNQGLYFLSFQTNDYTYVSKFVKIKP